MNIKTFRNFVIEQLTTKYIAVQYNEATQKKLREWAKKNGFDLTVNYDGTSQPEEDFDFHTTIFFTTSKHDLKSEVMNLDEPGTAKVVDIMMLGVNNNIPVLKVESLDIYGIRKYYENQHGMKDAWPEYKPHVSLSYSTDLPDMSKVKPPKFQLVFDKIKIADAQT